MELAISNHNGQYQYWHMDCKKGNHESPMYDPLLRADDVKEFKCAGCNKKGLITMPNIVVGRGTLEEITS